MGLEELVKSAKKIFLVLKKLFTGKQIKLTNITIIVFKVYTLRVLILAFVYCVARLFFEYN